MRKFLAISLAMILGAVIGSALTAMAGTPPGVTPVQFTDGTRTATLINNGDGTFSVLVSP